MRKIGIFAAVTMLLVLGLVAVAQAAATSPQDIYNDYAADSTLNGSYSDAQLQAYLDDAAVHQYGNQAVLTKLDALARHLISGEATGEGRGTFPFTGFEGVVVLLGSILLLGSGLAVRRATR
jgi:hypothetical protein